MKSLASFRIHKELTERCGGSWNCQPRLVGEEEDGSRTLEVLYCNDHLISHLSHQADQQP